jgi:DNA gyrase subunit A
VRGRATHGARLINFQQNDQIAAVTKVIREEETIDVTDEENISVVNIADDTTAGEFIQADEENLQGDGEENDQEQE